MIGEARGSPGLCRRCAKPGSPDPDPAFGQVSFQATSRGHETRTSRMRRSGDSKALRWLGFSLITLTTAVASAREVGEEGEGPASRVPWTGSKIVGTPDPPSPYAVEPAFPRLNLRFPVALVRAEGTDRLFVAELRGRISSFPEDPDCPRPDLRSTSPSSTPTSRRCTASRSIHDFEENRYRLRLLRPEGRPARRLGRLPVHREPDRSAGHRSRERAGDPHGSTRAATTAAAWTSATTATCTSRRATAPSRRRRIR